MDGFEWDEEKWRRNLADHGVDFGDAALIFEGEVLEAEDQRTRYGETRYRGLGRVGDDYFLVVYTWRGEKRRIISAWKVVGMAGEDIRRYSLDELRAMLERGETYTRPDAPEYELDEEFWQKARLVVPPGEKSVHLRVDQDVLAWFKAQGPRHLTRMNAVLRAYMDAHRK